MIASCAWCHGPLHFDRVPIPFSFLDDADQFHMVMLCSQLCLQSFCIRELGANIAEMRKTNPADQLYNSEEVIPPPIPPGEPDSTQSTVEHIFEVQRLLVGKAVTELHFRAMCHDDTKLELPEKPYFDRAQDTLSKVEYNSPEYHAALAELQVALDHHYAVHDHHPQHYPEGIAGMSAFAQIEMLCDWFASCKRVKRGSFIKSLLANYTRFSIPPVLMRQLISTSLELGFLTPFGARALQRALDRHIQHQLQSFEEEDRYDLTAQELLPKTIEHPTIDNAWWSLKITRASHPDNADWVGGWTVAYALLVDDPAPTIPLSHASGIETRGETLTDASIAMLDRILTTTLEPRPWTVAGINEAWARAFPDDPKSWETRAQDWVKHAQEEP